jgi:hypothetical protein
MQRIFIACLAFGLCAWFASCIPTDGYRVVAVDDACKLVSAKGVEITSLDVKDDDLITWTNNSGRTIKIVVSDPKTLGGRNSLRLEPGEKFTIRVAGHKGASMLRWYCGGGNDDDDDDDDKDDGSTGGNTPVNNGGSGGNG